MYYILISFVFLVMSSSLLSQDMKEYKFNWYPIIRILDEDTVLLPDSSKFENFNTSGVWEDSLGNYGIMRCVISQFTNKQKEITLEGYCEAKDNNKEMFWIVLRRNSFNKAGVGKGKYLFAQKKYRELENKECPYAAQLIDGGGILKLKCNLTKEEFKILEKNKI